MASVKMDTPRPELPVSAAAVSPAPSCVPLAAPMLRNSELLLDHRSVCALRLRLMASHLQDKRQRGGRIAGRSMLR